MAGIEASLMMGATIGISIAAPFGPTSMLCVQRTLSFGLCAGLATGLGIATVHLVYGTLASLSAAHILIASQHSPIFPVAASLLLLAFALRVVRSDVMAEAATGSSKDLGSVYWGAIGFGFLNPFTPLLFAAASPSLVSHDAASSALLITGIFFGSMVWWMLLLGGVSLFRFKLTPRFLTLANRASGILLGVMAATTLVRVCLSSI